MKTSIETVNEITRRWRREGKTYTIREAVAERTRQLCAAALEREHAILKAASEPGADPYTVAVAESIRDHHEANGADHASGCDRHH